jgi:N6-adenosine-specific RNA methylase IME4
MPNTKSTTKTQAPSSTTQSKKWRDVDRTRKVDSAYRRLLQLRDEDRVLKLVPVVGKWRTLLFNFPWQHEQNIAGRAKGGYAEMSLDQIRSFDVLQWAEDNCHIYLCCTNSMMEHAGPLLRHWGIAPINVITWVKPPPFGLGNHFRNSTEHIWFGIRGALKVRPAAHSIPTHFEAPTGEHSEKPERLYEIIRAASYPPYGEAFQRKARPDFVNLFAERGDPAPAATAPAPSAGDGLDIPEWMRRTKGSAL